MINVFRSKHLQTIILPRVLVTQVLRLANDELGSQWYYQTLHGNPYAL